MNIQQKVKIFQQILLQLPMIIVAVYVINREKKLIWQTLKSWWKWTWNWKEWPEERKNYYRILGVGVAIFFATILLGWIRSEMVEKNEVEIKKELVKDKLKTQTEIEEQEKKEKEEEKSFIKERGREPNSTPFYDYAPFFSFLTVVIIAPIAEECVFRYLIFETWGKKNPLAYLLSGTSFIFAHFATGGGILNFRTVGILLITYLPMTIYFIIAYYKSKWNILYPIYAHFSWNLFVWLMAILATYRVSS